MIQGLSKKEHAVELTKLRPELTEALNDFKELSKKKPHESVNKFKLKFVNKIILKANTILTEERLPDDEFEAFNEDEIPSNSDVVLMLNQYSAALKRLYQDAGIFQYSTLKGWIVNGERYSYNRELGLFRQPSEPLSREYDDDEEYGEEDDYDDDEEDNQSYG